MKVRFLKSPTGSPFFLAYNAGQTGAVRPELVADLVEAGIAEPVEEVKKATNKKAETATKAASKRTSRKKSKK